MISLTQRRKIITKSICPWKMYFNKWGWATIELYLFLPLLNFSLNLLWSEVKGKETCNSGVLRPITLWIIRSRNTCFISLAIWDSRPYNRIKHLHVALAVQNILDLLVCDTTPLKELILLAFWNLKIHTILLPLEACTILITCCYTSRRIW